MIDKLAMSFKETDLIRFNSPIYFAGTFYGRI